MGITVLDLKKSFRAPDGTVLRVLDVPKFALAPDSHMALLGTSGCGKTTFLHCIAGILRPDSGSIIINDNTDICRLTESQSDAYRGRHIGYIFQTHHLLPGFTALENVLLGMSFTGRKADRAWATHLLQAVGLQDRLHYKPAKLSIGQQQRVAVARALANRPSVVLADEPTGSLDATNATDVLLLIRQLCSEVKAALLLVTHDQDLANSLPAQVDLRQINLAAAPSSPLRNLQAAASAP